MIVLYSNNEAVVNGVHSACEHAGMEFQPGGQFSIDNVGRQLPRMRVLVVDLSCASLSTDKVLSVLEELESREVPPVLYLLSSPSDLDSITASGSIVNLDYSFLPVDPAQLSARLEVLSTLGLRRRRSMETAISDRLTGLYNRKYFLRRLDEEMYRTTRYNHDVGVLLADIDFEVAEGKLTEQTAGDLMPQIASFFRERLRRSDILARYKWSQFGILLPEIPAEDCEALANDIRQKLTHGSWFSEGRQVQVSPTVGWMMFPVENLGSSIEVMTALEDTVVHGRQTGSHVLSFVQHADVLVRSI